jgi:hypothetical protein
VAWAGLLGVPAERLLYGDALERVFWRAVTERALELEAIRRENQAIANAGQIGRVLRRMFKGR